MMRAILFVLLALVVVSVRTQVRVDGCDVVIRGRPQFEWIEAAL